MTLEPPTVAAKGDYFGVTAALRNAGWRGVGLRIQERGYESPCWIWPGRPDGSNGYGRVRLGGVRKPAHRAVYELVYGPLPEDRQIDHLCFVPLCVRPGHLEVVTGQVNNQRRRWNKLTAEDAAEIRAFRDEYFKANPLNAKGAPRTRLVQGVVPELARRYGCSPEAISHVLKGRTWG